VVRLGIPEEKGMNTHIGEAGTTSKASPEWPGLRDHGSHHSHNQRGSNARGKDQCGAE